MKKLSFLFLAVFLISCEANREIVRFFNPFHISEKPVPKVNPPAKEPEKKRKMRHYPPYYNARDFYKPQYIEQEKQSNASKKR